jgi:hypothetical protein
MAESYDNYLQHILFEHAIILDKFNYSPYKKLHVIFKS